MTAWPIGQLARAVDDVDTYRFDTQGYFVLPAVLSPAELTTAVQLYNGDDAAAAQVAVASLLSGHEGALRVVRELVGGGHEDPAQDYGEYPTRDHRNRFFIDEPFRELDLSAPAEGEPHMEHWGGEGQYFFGARGQRFSSGLRLVWALSDTAGQLEPPQEGGGLVLIPAR